MKTLSVSLTHHQHKVWIGHKILENVLPRVMPSHLSRVILIADSKLKAQALQIQRSLKKLGISQRTLSLPVSEELKNFEKVYPLYGNLLAAGADRHSLILALGGGVIGDVAGFVAGTYLRGIPWISLPTTFLAQVDSGLGGKTGVNHPRGKNLIGVFHQPSAVLCDLSFLKTLPKREIVSGLGEILKYGLVFDPVFFSWLQKNWSRVQALESGPLEKAVYTSLKWKAQAVAKDEWDRKGVREVLNFGHTLGHALEVETQFKRFRHGEAVVWGMRIALELSHIRGYLALEVHQHLSEFLSQVPVPSLPRSLRTQNWVGRLKWDKKSKNGRVRFVLLKGVGQPILDREVRDFEIREAVENMRRLK